MTHVSALKPGVAFLPESSCNPSFLQISSTHKGLQSSSCWAYIYPLNHLLSPINAQKRPRCVTCESPLKCDIISKDKWQVWQESIRMWSKSNKHWGSQDPGRLLVRGNGCTVAAAGGRGRSQLVAVLLQRATEFYFVSISVPPRFPFS